ncbi:hypothetical protein P691DRAFT_424967 [Macrolepiota fuliginosa MF-IS2]|uniref:Protein kinase domain-containing protein n=1 Tax=Macrolepiota fuliginosa MF-IS2 TaxID=1400762 RepID=A0A9P5XJW5_9AGAR|nr:hypothetical protein P691DRAFT_424967 [Macrolepiota fuliginosa MF-IS2]
MRPQTKARSSPVDTSIRVVPEKDLHVGESITTRGQILNPFKSNSGTSTEATTSGNDTTSSEIHRIERSAADQLPAPGAEPPSRKAKDSRSWHPRFIFKQLTGRASAAKSWASTEFASERRVWNIWKHANEAKNVETEELTEDDTIIALMGSTGTGKSSFISKAVGRDVGIGHGLQSCTNEINAIRVQVPGEHFGLVLVDTPGFDDTRKSHAEILELISRWLEQICKKKVLLSGILYLHRIPDNRMAGTLLKNLKTFEKLCGTESCSQIIMVTTMWDALADKEVGERREEELKSTFWEPMMRRGSSTQRYGDTEQSAWSILEQFLHAPRERRERRLEKELVDLQNALSKAVIGKEISTAISDFLEEQMPRMRTLKERMRQMDVSDEAFVVLQEEYRNLEGQRHELLMRARALQKKLQEVPGPPDHLRAVLFNVLEGSFDKAVEVVEGLDSKDIRPMADFLSLVLNEEGVIMTIEGNRILTLLSKIATSAQVYPHSFELKKVRWEPDKLIARGGFAEVYKGRYENHAICVKIVIFECNSAALTKESTLWAHLSHPNILPFYGVFMIKESRQMGLVSPWMENGTLCDYSKKLAQDRRMPLISDTLEGLLYLHRLGIVHSDLKAFRARGEP